MSLDDTLAELLRDVVRTELAVAGTATPAPYPIGCSIDEAARLLGVGRDKIRELVQLGRIRRLDLGDSDRPGARVVISTLSLFELDTAAAPDRLAQVLELDRRPA